jgi:predicted NBD/HSP70 family sugar kinase
LIISTYNEGENFEILPWGETLIAQLSEKVSDFQEVTERILRPFTVIAVNIGKTKIKFGLLKFRENGRFEIVKVMDRNVWEEGDDRAKFEVLFEKIISGIKEILLESGFRIEEIDGIGISGAVLVRHSQPLPLRVSFARFFSEQSFIQFTHFCEEISQIFGGIPVVMGNDGNMEAVAVSKLNKLRNTLVLKLGTTLASGYVDEKGLIPEGIDEFNRVVVDMSPGAVMHTGMMVAGPAGCYIGWWGVENITKLLGLYEKYNFKPQDKVPLILKSWLTNGTAEQKEDAEKVFRKIGEYITELALELSRFYRIDNVMISGGLVSGKAGEIILEAARDKCNKLSDGKNVNFLLSSTDLDILRYGALIGAGYLLTGWFSTDMKREEQ